MIASGPRLILRHRIEVPPRAPSIQQEIKGICTLQGVDMPVGPVEMLLLNPVKISLKEQLKDE